MFKQNKMLVQTTTFLLFNKKHKVQPEDDIVIFEINRLKYEMKNKKVKKLF